MAKLAVRSRLKICFPLGSVGSSPTEATMNCEHEKKLIIFTNQDRPASHLYGKYICTKCNEWLGWVSKGTCGLTPKVGTWNKCILGRKGRGSSRRNKGNKGRYK